ncbi:MAG: gliding motility-associated C-terminal domain-containing protein [Bacteroidetes bacterium]|nr:gliding motility-associated C-terminal domain-containing protein [Bacteroidota bacterium]
MKKVLFFLLLFISQISINAQIWSEDFNSYGPGTFNAPPKWTTTATDCDDGGNINGGPGISQWGVYAGQFTCNDIEGFPCCAGGGGGGQNEWNSESIDISNNCDVTISVDVSGMGGLECDSPGVPVLGCQGVSPPDNSHDQIILEYNLNGGGFVQFGYVCGNVGLGPINSPPLNGNTLQIRITIANKANAEFYYLDNIVVNGLVPPTPTFAPIGPLCETDPPTALPSVSNEGITGTWDVGPVFNPAGQGGQVVTINFTPNPGQCALPTSMMVTVNTATTITLLPLDPLCNTDPPAVLNPAPNGIPGTWSGIGISGNTFNPAGLGGTYTLTFTPNPGQCANIATTTVMVNLPATPILTGITLCANDPPYDLTLLQDPAYSIGFWQGPGVIPPNLFNPVGLSGPVNLTFISSDDCVLPANTIIQVNEPATPILGLASICDDNGIYDLTLLQDPNYSLGSWSGMGVTGSNFDPTGLNGPITLTWVPTENCVEITTTTITVNTAATPTLGIDIICEDNGIYDLTLLEDLAYTGGTWSGMGVTGTDFDPTGLSGPITLTYDPNQSCVQMTTTTITVNMAAIPTLGTDEICEDNGLYDLTVIGDSNFPSGTWSGNGVTGIFFDPSGLSGNIDITFTSDQVCVAEVTTIITVNTIATPNLGTDQICENNGLYDLSILLDPNYPNGTWSGPGVTGNFFDPDGNTGIITIDFISTESCQTDAFTTIEVLIPDMPVLGQDSICENSGLYDLTQLLDTLYTTGTWSGTGVNGNDFDPNGNSGIVILTFTSDQNCVDTSTTQITVSASETPVLQTAMLCENDDTLNLNTLLDPNFTTGSWSGIGVAGNNFIPAGQNGMITLTFQSDQDCVNPANTIITVDTLISPDLSSADICEEDGIFDLLTLQDPNFPNGTWSGQNVSGNNFDPTGLDGSILLTFTPSGDCQAPSNTSININSAPSFINLVENCMPGDPTYTITFEITGGDSTTYTVDGNPVNGTIFTSGPIINGDAYSFDIDDANGCGPVTVNGSFNCDCETNAGSMDFTNSPLQVCDGNGFVVFHNGNENLDLDDLFIFVLHDEAGTQLGNIIATNTTPDFDFPAGIIFGQTYYVSAVAGTDDGTGNIDFNDGCLSVSQGVPVSFYQLGVQLGTGGTVCENDCFEFSVTFTGTPPFDFIYSVSTAQNNFLDTLTSNSNFTTINICPSELNIKSGDIEVFPTSLNDINCDNFTQNSIVQIVTVDSIPINQYTPALCPGETEIVNGTIYDESNPIGTEIIQGGSAQNCDSIIEVNLVYFLPSELTITDSLCEDESIIINGIVFDIDNPFGTEVLMNASENGCDSTIFIDLTFFENPETTLNPTLCETESVIVNGTVYDFANPIGTEIFAGDSQNGCDSTVFIQLDFYTPVSFSLQETLCDEDFITVNGVVYDQSNPTGTEIFSNSTLNGCDSTVNIQLDFYSIPTGNITQSLCEDDFLDVNGTIYDINNPSGFETFQDGSYLGCDSTVEISLTFIPPSIFDLNQTLCAGSSIIVNGNIYNETNPTGTETLDNASQSGCDSIVNINLGFTNEVVFVLMETLCQGDSIEVNGTVYNQNNPNGSETFVNGSFLGCDSIVNISLSFFTAAEFFLLDTLCEGGNIIVNGVNYDIDNPAGTEILPGVSTNGCDSIINISLTFLQTSIFEFNPTICINDFVIVEGNIYDINMPTGAETIPGGNYLGCDSIINIDLDFFLPSEFQVTDELCPGESIIINNTVYDQNNPSGFEILPNQSLNGCDSIIIIDLFFYPDAIGNLQPTLCEGEFLDVNGVIYDENNPTGQTFFPNGSFNGCDSTLNINLTFLNNQTSEVMETLQVGQSIIINGTTYDVNNPTGTEVLQNGASNGCDSIISIFLEFYEELTIEWFTQAPTCFGDEDGFIQIDTIYGGSGMGYFVNIEGQPPFFYDLNQFPIVFSDLQSGVYPVVVTDEFGENKTLNAEVANAVQIVVELGDDQTVILGESYILTPQLNVNPDSILWSPGDYLNCNNCFPAISTPTEDIVYELIITDENGCTGSDEIELFVQKVRSIYTPNAFSPNNDGSNDFFTVFAGQNVDKVNTLQVYSRWGESLFEARDFTPNDISFGWDGNFNGEKMDAGVYVFFAEILFVDGHTEIFKGDFVLIR